MVYRTIMLQMDLERSNDARVQVAGDVAAIFGSVVIGAASCDPSPINPGISDADVRRDQSEATVKMIEAERLLSERLRGHVKKIEWRSGYESPAAFLAQQCRAADLLITGTRVREVLQDPHWRLDPHDLIMAAGRPMLLVPADVSGLAAKRIVVAWKDTREARRAVWDALPFLRHAEEVFVASVTYHAELPDHSSQVEDVVNWLGRHDVEARPRLLPADRRAANLIGSAGDDANLHEAGRGTRCVSADSDVARQIDALAAQEDADLIVSGAFGHYRLREWVLGGVTRDLMAHSRRCVLLSH